MVEYNCQRTSLMYVLVVNGNDNTIYKIIIIVIILYYIYKPEKYNITRINLKKKNIYNNVRHKRIKYSIYHFHL